MIQMVTNEAIVIDCTSNISLLFLLFNFLCASWVTETGDLSDVKLVKALSIFKTDKLYFETDQMN